MGNDRNLGSAFELICEGAMGIGKILRILFAPSPTKWERAGVRALLIRPPLH
jgi:hypothetical protein